MGDRALVLIFTRENQIITVKAEVARTAEQRSQGLMYRKELGEDEGMLFLMPYSGYHQFWMKNTLETVFFKSCKKTSSAWVSGGSTLTKNMAASAWGRY